MLIYLQTLETPDEKAEEFLRQVLDNMKLESVVIEKKLVEGGVEFDISGLNATRFTAAIGINQTTTHLDNVTAGIAKFKSRKLETERKLERAHEEGSIYIHNLDYFNLGKLSSTHLMFEKTIDDTFPNGFIQLAINAKNEIDGEMDIIV